MTIHKAAAVGSARGSGTFEASGWRGAELRSLLDGDWAIHPDEGWRAEDIALSANRIELQNDNCLFVAIDEETWHRGSGNSGVYAGWSDTHEALKQAYRRCCGAIVQRPVSGLPDDFPQLVVKDSYAVLHKMADEARGRMTGKVIAVTGTVGKSTVKDMLAMVLADQGSVVTTRKNHNTRTGTSVTLARCIGDPDFAVLEIALSALWMRSGGVGPRVKPHIGIVTEVGVSQVGPNIRNKKDTALFKARVCNGIVPGGHAVLNRDMTEFDVVANEVSRYGANVLSYGFHSAADVRVLEHRADHESSDVRVLVGGQEIEFRLAVPGRAMVSNAIAVLAAMSLLGLDVPAAAGRMAEYRSAGKLEGKLLPLPEGGCASMIDDNYNAEVQSMMAAFEVAALHPVPAGARRVAVLGRMINLGERAPDLHASLAEPIAAAGFDKVFLHGEEMRHLQEKLPAQMDGGLFSDAPGLVDAVMDYLHDGDTVLVKGSVRNSDFRSVPELMMKAGRMGLKPLPASSSAGMLLDLVTGKVLAAHNEAYAIPPRHLSQLLLVALIADRISRGKLRLDDAVTVKPVSPKVSKDGLLAGLPAGSQTSVSDLIRAMVICNARDAAISLAEHLSGSSAAALEEMRGLAAAIGMDSTVVTNVSGRAATGQRTTVKDIVRLLQHFSECHPNRLHWFSASETTFANKLFRTPGNLVAGGRANFAFSSGGNPAWGFAIDRVDGRLFLACAAGAHDAFNLDYRLDALLAKAGSGQQSSAEETRLAPSVAMDRPFASKSDSLRVNVLGDTYFGEWYSARRRRRGVEDGLARHGYDHSFLRIRQLLAEGDYNIANFEAALSFHREEGLATRKPFVLTGDPGRSVAALRRAGIHAVSLGNNHASDAGARGLADTLQAFDAAGIARFGAGREATEAEAPLVLRTADRTYKFFSAYWHRRYMEHDCAFYALPRRGGVACISGGLLDLIRAEKRQDSPATVIVLAHWGSDYSWTAPAQRLLARRIVEAGADLVIGSGPHMLGEFEKLDGRWVLYSVGNGVFNSDGEYERRSMPPYGFVTRLNLVRDGMQLHLYPIFTDNPKTFWQPRPVTLAEFEHVLKALRERGISIANECSVDAAWHTKDEAGRPIIVLPASSRSRGDLARQRHGLRSGIFGR